MPQNFGLGNIARALRNPNFRIFTTGNAVSLIGTWMHRVVTGWLTWELTQSGLWLGLIAFADLFPTVIVGPFAGAYADRLDRLKVTKISQALAMAQSIALLILTATGLINIWLLLVLTLFLGIVAAFNQPARLALVPQLVQPGDLPAAIAVNSIVLNLARFIGPAAAGLVIAWVGIPVAYAVNALSYLVFMVALARIRLAREDDSGSPHGSLLQDLAAGLRYTTSHFGIATVLILLIATNLGTRPIIELLPGFAAEVFRGGATELAILTSSIGIGSIFAGFWVSARSGSLAPVLFWSMILGAIGAALFAASQSLWIGICFAAVTGFAMAAFGISSQILVQGVGHRAYARACAQHLRADLSRGARARRACHGRRFGAFRLAFACIAGGIIVGAAWLWAWFRRKRMMDSLTQK